MLTQRAVPVAFSVGTDERAAAAEASCHDIITNACAALGYIITCVQRESSRIIARSTKLC